MVMMTIDDFRVVKETGDVIDWWKDKEAYPEDQLRLPTKEEYWQAVKACAEISELGYCCFTEKHADEKDNREYPADVPPICPSCGNFIDVVWYNSYDSYAFTGKGAFKLKDDVGDCDIKCPTCHHNLSDVFEEGPINYTPQNMQDYLERETQEE